MSTPDPGARWARGALVGVCSAVLTVSAHTAGGGGLPRGSALVAAVLVCAAAGAAIGAARLAGRRVRPAVITAALAIAQLLGHLTLAVGGGHHGHAAAWGLSPAMLTAHLAAAALLGVAISAVEYAYVVAASVLCWLRLFAAAALRPAAPARRWTTEVVAAQPILLRSGLGMRAPPGAPVPAV